MSRSLGSPSDGDGGDAYAVHDGCDCQSRQAFGASDEIPDLSGVNLSSASLCNAVLRGADLSSADLSGAKCCRVNFRRAFRAEGDVLASIAANLQQNAEPSDSLVC